jgi:beta-lactamase superfamily II metal-dependent hydrolase
MYNPKIWYDGDIVTSGGLNNIEQGIAQNAQDIEDLQGALGGNMESYVDDWLDSHPEATTTVQDGAITTDKLANAEFIFPKKWTGARSGDASIIKYQGKVVLIDCHRADAYTQFKQMLVDNDVEHIDYFILTHYHADHYGNIGNLIEDNYIDGNTVIYLPPDGTYLTALNWNTTASAIKGVITGAGLTYVNATESTKININQLQITFCNCDADYFATIVGTYTNQNDYSIINLVEFGDKKALFSGDNMGIGLMRALNTGFVTGFVDLYKVEHHGINHSAHRANELASFNSLCAKKLIDTITPTYAVQISGTENDEQNEYNRNFTTVYLKECGAKLFASHISNDYIKLRSTMTDMEVVAGNEVVQQSNFFTSINVYVDINTVDAVQDGSEEHPFKELSQAIAKTASMTAPCFEYRYILADGTYNNSHETAEKNMINLSGVRIRIESASADKTKVIIKNGCILNDGYIYFGNVTLDNGLLAFYNSVATLSGCAVTNNGGITNAVTAYRDSMLYVEDTAFDGFATAIYNSSSRVHLRQASFANGTTALLNSYGGVYTADESTVTYTSVTNTVLNSNYGQGRILTTVTQEPKQLKDIDLNDIKARGEYYCVNGSDAQSLTNSPVTIAFTMIVMKAESADGGRVTQLIIAGSAMYMRNMSSSGFSSWYKFQGTAI